MADKKISQLPTATTPLAGTEVLPIVQSGTTDQVSVANLTAGRAISATQYTSTIATGTAPLIVASTTEVANLKAATATLSDSATSANAIKSNATTGVLQVTGPAAASTRVMTTPDANFTVARTDAAQSFTADQTLTTGNLVIGTSGKGIDFSATAGTGTSELLADYEEGTWTPGISFDTAGDLSVSYAVRSATYTKVGRQVFCQMWIVTSAFTYTTASGNLFLTGLPYTVGGASSNTTGSIGVYRGIGLKGGCSTITVQPEVGATICYFVQTAYSTNAPQLTTTTEIGSGNEKQIRVQFSYLA